MIQPFLLACLTLGWSVASPVADESPRWIEGRVVDSDGRPVANVDVESLWSANGTHGFGTGKAVDLKTSAGQAIFWGNVGRMDPHPFNEKTRAKTSADGAFRVEYNPSTNHVMVMNADRTLGALSIISKGQEGLPLTIKLEFLVRVKGEIRGPELDQKSGWSMVETMLVNEDRPLDNLRVVTCGSFNSDFSMLLPPGRYEFNVHDDQSTARVVPYPELTITGSEGVIDLGTLRLSRTPEAIVPRMKRVKLEKHLPNLKDLVGQSPPPVFAEDARGVPRDWQLGQSPGKWQFVEFWGMGCIPCLKVDLPALTKFHDDHARQADQFEIVTVFLDPDEKIRTIADLDKNIKSIITHVWGKPLPFPTLVDPSYRTCESWGLSGYGEQVLINPEGKIVAGNLETLRSILDKK